MEDMPQWVIEGRYFLYHEGYLISESVAHIYHSALPLCPQTSLFRHQYENDLKSEASVVNRGYCTSLFNSLTNGLGRENRGECSYELV